VIRDDVEDLAQTEFSERAAEPTVRSPAAQLRVEGLVVDHVVSVKTSRSGLQIRRTIYVRYAELTKIVRDSGSRVEREVLVKLETVSRLWSA
jgi:hypothetical protein